MTHRAETIMQAMVATLGGLTTTGENVFRGRAYDLKDLPMPALLVWQGDDRQDEASGWFRVRSVLTVNIEAVAREASAQIDETLNTIRKEVAAAIGGSANLGLAFEIGALEREAEAPAIDAGDAAVGRLRMVWEITYWRSRADPAN